MEISIADQIALDDALVAPADRLKIGKCNLRLSSDVTSKEATLQVVYDVLKLTPFYKAFQVTADAPEIYMQEFWASAYVHNRSVRFKMNNKKHILGLDQFRDILQICPKVGNKKFEEPPLEKEILAFLASLGHSGEIRKITDVNVNKLHQPWRSFAAIINKCLSGKPSYDSLRLSQAQILWGMYNKKNVDYAYLLWEDFIYQIENKNTKKGNAMYYPRFTKLVVNFVMDKDPSIPRRNKVNWHYARDDPMFTTINVISRNEDTQLYKTILLVALTNEDIRNSESYKEYYAIASGTIPPKTKGRKQKTIELETISEVVLTEAEQLKIITKRSRKETHSSHCQGSGADEGTGVTPGFVGLGIKQNPGKMKTLMVTLNTPVNPDGQHRDCPVSSGFVSNDAESKTRYSRQTLLDTYGDTVIIKRPRDGADEDQEPSAGTDRGSKRRRSGKEPESTSALRETTTTKAGKTTTGSKTHKHQLAQLLPEEDTIPTNRFTKTMAANYGHIKWIEDLVPNSMWSQIIVKYDKFALWGISNWGKKRRHFYAFATTRESARDVYSKRRILVVTKVEIVEWQNYKHLEWITVRRDDDVLYKFKEGDFHRLRIQDIEDMLLLLLVARKVQSQR
ncbi:hypothetical protein Tco_1016967 [Tanacetum coccineum]|uniref:Uncharacterized protein n=1 Tax=Tanacetum coccineum TaxID=301880 RepID=A0ABQ5FS43_9ASTR